MKNPKVGERVAVYGHRACGRERFVGVVSSIDGVWLSVTSTEGPVATNVHPMQCRRLVRRERERIWVFQRDDGTYDGGPVTTAPGAEKPRVRGASGHWREFVAVKPKGQTNG